EIPYDKPDKLARRLRVAYPIRADSLLCGGIPPGVRLQQALRNPPRLSTVDVALTATHYLLWLAPHAVLMAMLARDEERFPRAAGRLGAVYHATTLAYWAVPTAPPWWASEQSGELGQAIQHVTRDVTLAARHRLTGQPPPSRDERLQADRENGNPWGTMPSDAFPAALMTAMTLGEISPVAGAIGWTLALAHGAVLVYLGEHYLTDLIAGWALVEVLWRAEPLLLPVIRAATDSLRVLERLAA
ncbi:MAG: phosphatase PAP2 family protein, partial [Actinobacteria bacterium]|nr:phosphatase PAP2 family protein [Actinomycetota bacterium]